LGLEKLNGIIFKALPFSETSLILDIYSRQNGLHSYIVSGVRKKKSSVGQNLYKPINVLNFVAYTSDQEKLFRIKEAKYEHIYEQINRAVIPSTVAMFMIDLCRSTIKERESNPHLYDFIFHQLIALDRTKETLQFHHLRFAIDLTQFLGFYPRDNWSEENPIFNLESGVFSPNSTGSNFGITAEESKLLFDLMRGDSTIISDKQTRQKLLDGLMMYYQLHVEGFKPLASLEVCRTLFS